MRREPPALPIQSFRSVGLRATAALAASAAVACAPPTRATTAADLQPAGLGAPALAGRLVGCWVLTWTFDGRDAQGGDEYALPDSVSLRDGPVFGTSARLVSPATHPEGREHTSSGPRPWEDRFRVNRWWVEDDSLLIRFSDGGEDQWLVRLGLDEASAFGWARAGPSPERTPTARAGVGAVRIGCAFG